MTADDRTRQLQRKALLVLEEAVHTSRYQSQVRSYGIRFALAYLWVTSGADRDAFDDFWRILGEDVAWRTANVGWACYRIHNLVGIERDEAMQSRVWREVQARLTGRAVERGPTENGPT